MSPLDTTGARPDARESMLTTLAHSYGAFCALRARHRAELAAASAAVAKVAAAAAAAGNSTRAMASVMGTSQPQAHRWATRGRPTDTTGGRTKRASY